MDASVEAALGAASVAATLGLAMVWAVEWTSLDQPLTSAAFARLLRAHDAYVVLLVAAATVLVCATLTTGSMVDASERTLALQGMGLIAVLTADLPLTRRMQRWRRLHRALPGLVPPRPWELRILRRHLMIAAAGLALVATLGAGRMVVS